MAKKTGIYQVRQLSNDQVVYIGSSVDIEKRLKQHRDLLRRNKHGNAKLQDAYNQGGGLDFEFSAVELCPEGQLTKKENEWINATDPLYNVGPASRRRVSGVGNDGNFIRKKSVWSHWFWKD